MPIDPGTAAGTHIVKQIMPIEVTKYSVVPADGLVFKPDSTIGPSSNGISFTLKDKALPHLSPFLNQ